MCLINCSKDLWDFTTSEIAPVSKVVSGNLINSGDIRTSSEISLLTNLITVDFPIPNTFLIVWNEFPVESQSLFIDRVEIDTAHNVKID